ncbi:MAG: MBL fold metallo-hydrolase, partial [Muribaculaceae bacterium]|nr:MBL fold metallo-hydrolase [Muribaculaceae bacterium]
TYIWHDCFVFTNNKLSIVFDFWKDPMSDKRERPLFLDNVDESKPLYILVSHHHKDHFSKDIFEWSNQFPHIHFILSEDVYRHSRHIFNEESLYKGTKLPPHQLTVLKKGETFEDNIIKVKAFGSTDIGNSYSIETEGLRLFHAGDLNAWIWKDESTEQEVEEALKSYIDILTDINRDYKEFDIVMFPVDSRIGTDYYIGAKIFVEKFNVKYFFPMHFCLGESREMQIKYSLDASRFQLYAKKGGGEYISLLSPYSNFTKMQTD